MVKINSKAYSVHTQIIILYLQEGKLSTTGRNGHGSISNPQGSSQLKMDYPAVDHYLTWHQNQSHQSYLCRRTTQ